MGLIPRPAIFDQNIAALEKTGFVQAQAKCRHQIGPRLWRNRMENPITGIPAAARTPRAATLPRRRAIAPRFFSLDCGCRRSFSLSGVAVCAHAAARPTSDSANRDLRQQEKARYANGLIGNSLAPRLAAQGRAHRLISQAAQPAFAVRRPNRNLILEKNHIANAAASAAPNIHKR